MAERIQLDFEMLTQLAHDIRRLSSELDRMAWEIRRLDVEEAGADVEISLPRRSFQCVGYRIPETMELSSGLRSIANGMAELADYANLEKKRVEQGAEAFESLERKLAWKYGSLDTGKDARLFRAVCKQVGGAVSYSKWPAPTESRVREMVFNGEIALDGDIAIVGNETVGNVLLDGNGVVASTAGTDGVWTERLCVAREPEQKNTPAAEKTTAKAVLLNDVRLDETDTDQTAPQIRRFD